MDGNSTVEAVQNRLKALPTTHLRSLRRAARFYLEYYVGNTKSGPEILCYDAMVIIAGLTRSILTAIRHRAELPAPPMPMVRAPVLLSNRKSSSVAADVSAEAAPWFSEVSTV